MYKHQYERLAEIAFKLNSDLPELFQSQIFSEGIRELQSRSKDKQDRKILLIGGAGYIGSVLTKHLLECGYKIRCLDLLLYENNECVIPYLMNENYEFIFGDFTNSKVVSDALIDITDVVILGGLVGDPITKKYPDISLKINHFGVLNLIDTLNHRGLNKVIFISTCSNYGIVNDNQLADETSELSPLSLYAKAKVAIERHVGSLRGNIDYSPTILRFATAFGLSPRTRFDLTVNQFVRELYLGNEVLVYDAETWRPYCHVQDFSLAVRRVLESPIELVNFEIFNAGGDKNNFTKNGVVDSVKKFIPHAKVTFKEKGSDPRDYRVNFKKIRETLYFEPRYSVTDGITEILNALNQNVFNNVDARKNFYENHQIMYAA